MSNSLGGVASQLLTGPVTASDLVGIDLFLAPRPSAAFSIAEITAISNFITGGGTVFLMGEAQDLSLGTNDLINSLLASLGSGLSLTDANLDIGPQVATGSQITAHPLTTGVLAYHYGYASAVEGGTPLFLTTNGTPFVAVEAVVVSVPEPAMALLLTSGLGIMGITLAKAGYHLLSNTLTGLIKFQFKVNRLLHQQDFH